MYYVMDSKELYGKIMEIDPKIRFTTIASIDGKIEHTGHREGVSNVLTPRKARNHFSKQ